MPAMLRRSRLPATLARSAGSAMAAAEVSWAMLASMPTKVKTFICIFDLDFANCVCDISDDGLVRVEMKTNGDKVMIRDLEPGH